MPDKYIDFKIAFEAMPGSFLIIQPDAPHYTILAISDELLQITGMEREFVTGKSIFEVYPENPDVATATGPSMMRTALNNVLQNKVPDQLPVVRYDVANAAGVFEERHWSAGFKPVIDPAGEVLYIIQYAHEVTEQLKAEKAQRTLREIEKTYKLFMQAPVAVCIVTGPENIIELANEEHLRILGQTTNIIGKPLIEAIPEATAQGITGLLDQVRKTGDPFYATEQPVTLHINGKEEACYFNFLFKPYYENADDNTPSGVFYVSHDVTEQVEARKKVEEESERARLAIEVGELGVFEINYNSLDMVADERFNEIFGFDKPANRSEYLAAFHPDDLLVRDKALEIGLQTGSFAYEVRIIKKKQEVRWVKIQGRLFRNEKGEPSRVLGVVQDTTDQNKYAEELKKFKLLSDYAFDAFILMREDGSFAYLNDLALKRWDYTEEEALHIRVKDVDPIYQEETFNNAFALAQKQFLPPFETFHKRKDGSLFPVEVSMGGLILGGKPHMFAIARDITERKLAEETLKSRNEELQRINNDLDNFVYTASHDLKAPISNIEALLESLLRTLPEESVSGRVPLIIGMMQESVERFKKTISSLTAIVKLQQESEQGSVLISLPELIQEICLDLEQEINSAGVLVEVDVAACPTIHFSEKNLRSIVYNLLSNGIKYRSAEREPRVQVQCEKTDEFTVLTVSDNGLGIDQEQNKQLFTMFKRFHDHVEGTGIGLYMVKKIVENAGGRIEVESQIGIGTTFRVLLPR